MHEGHRKRMLERLSKSDLFCEHELLEILLFNAVPRKNTNELAHALLDTFGSIQGIFEAPMSAIMAVNGAGEGVAAYLHCIALFYRRLPEVQSVEIPVAYNMREFSSFLAEKMRGYTEEAVEVFCIDGKSRVFMCKQFSSNRKNTAYVPPRELSALLVEQRPAGLVIAHNHPSGSCLPSVDDDEFTARVEMLCSANNVRLIDHVIVSKEDVFSYFTAGRLDEIRLMFNFNTLAKRGLF